MMKWARIAGICIPAFCLWAQAVSASEDPNIVLTVSRVIYPGQVVGADAIVETKLRKPLRNGLEVVRDAGEIVGKVALRTILPKRLIRPDAVREVYAVEAGEPATVYYRQGGLVIAMDAVALSSAGYGDPIRLRNTSSGRTITGTVTADGTVVVEAR